MRDAFQSWEKIFDAKHFDAGQDLHFITADEIKAISGAEPRILAKMDSSAALPPVFKRNGYFLLPVRNGKYAIVRGEGFHRLEPEAPPQQHVSRIKFHLTTSGRGASEMQYLDYCFNAGAIEAALGIPQLYQSIRGREYSREFRFSVNRSALTVSSVQFEVDSGLEGEDSIVLIEAKVGRPDDFIIRQLFYPYNHFRLVSPRKRIIPVFFTYSMETKVFRFWIYEFADPGNYNSIRLSATKSLIITTEQEIELADIKPKGLVAYKQLVPQANDLNKVVELVFKVSEGINHYKDVAEHFGFDERQSSYYREAAEALGLVTRAEGRYHLTEVANQLVDLPVEKRNLFMVELVSDFDLIKRSLDTLRESGRLNRLQVEQLIKEGSHLSGSTIPRRAGSLMAWLKWIADVTGSFALREGAFVVER